jgi:hypothetical protein
VVPIAHLSDIFIDTSSAFKPVCRPKRAVVLAGAMLLAVKAALWIEARLEASVGKGSGG